MFSRRSVCLLIWSMTRPGVPTIIDTFPLSERICLVISCPPYIGRILIPCMNFANLRSSSAAWIASSLVGQSIIHCTPSISGSILCIIGIPNAAVLPVPVCAWPSTSRPSRSAGIACCCIGVITSKPISCTARIILSSIGASSYLTASLVLSAFLISSAAFVMFSVLVFSIKIITLCFLFRY